jgi:iron complex outermembrane receptor protein
VLYRFIANYQSSNGFQDFVNTDLVTIAPSITLNFSDRTNLNLYYEYINFSGIFEQYTSALSDNTLLPRSFYQAYPNGAFVDNTTQKLGYVLNHELSDSWQLRNNFSITASQNDEEYTLATSVVDDRSLTQFAQEREFPQDNYFGQIDLLGEFSTGAISHRLLVGFDFNRNVEIFQRAIARNVPNLDIFNPNYNIPDFNYGPTSSTYTAIQSYGVYLQDQVDLLDNLKLLIGGRFDWVSVNETSNGDDSSEQNDTAFSPRVGLVYQPSDMVALYASYSQSFLPTSGFSQDNQPFEPTRGTQYEVGVKTDFFDGNLSATLAAYQLTRSNVETPDPENPDFSIQVGEQRSRGIELDIGGEILPGWNLIASYAYTDARTTRDNAIEEGNRLTSVPENQASLWTTYEIQEGDLSGLGFGLGLFYVGERQGDLDNSFVLPNYLRTDAAVYYRRGQLNTAINIRNLFNTDYIRTSDGGNTFLRRGAPFTIVGSISWEF